MRLSCRILALFDIIAYLFEYAVSINDSRGDWPRHKLLESHVSHVFNALRRQRHQNLDTRKITGCELKRISRALCFQQVVLVPSLTTQERGNYCHPKKGGARSSRGKVSLTALPFFTYCRLQESVLHGKLSRLHLGYIPANTVLQPWTLPAGMKLRLSTNLITRILKASYDPCGS